jgi:hypothetical protein
MLKGGFGFVRFDGESDKGSTTKAPRTKSAPRRRENLSSFPLLNFEDSNGVSPTNLARRWDHIDHKESKELEWPAPNASEPTEWPAVQSTTHNGAREHTRQEPSNQVLKSLPIKQFSRSLSNQRQPKNRNDEFSPNGSRPRPRAQSFDPFTSAPNDAPNENIPWHDPQNRHTAYRQQYALEEPGTENSWPHVVDASGDETRKEVRKDIDPTGRSKRVHISHGAESSHGAWSYFGPVENPGGGTKGQNIDGHTTSEPPTRPVFSEAIPHNYAINHQAFHEESRNVPDYFIADGMASVYSELTMEKITNNVLIPDVTPESEAPIHHSNRFKLPGGGRYATDEMVVRSDKGKKIAAVSARLGAQPWNTEPLPQIDESGKLGGQEQESSQSELEAEPSIKSAPKSIPPQKMSEDDGKFTGNFYTRRKERHASIGSSLKEQQPEFMELEIAESASFPDRERPIEFFKSKNSVGMTEDTYEDDIFLSFAQLGKSKPQENAIFSDEPLDIEKNEHELLSPMFFSKTPCAAALQSFNGQSQISTSTPPKNSRPPALEIPTKNADEALKVGPSEMLLPAVEQKSPCSSKPSVSTETKTGVATEETPDSGMLSQSPESMIPEKKVGSEIILPAVEQQSPCKSKLSVSTETKTEVATEETPDTGMLSQNLESMIPEKKVGMLWKFFKMAAPILSRGAISMAQEEPIRRAAKTLGIPLMDVADETEEETPTEMVEFPLTSEHETQDFTSSIRAAAVKIRKSKNDQKDSSIEVDYDLPHSPTGDSAQVSATASNLSARSQLLYPIETMESLLDSASEIGDDRSNANSSLGLLNSNQFAKISSIPERDTTTDCAQVTQKLQMDPTLPSTIKEDQHETHTPLESKTDEPSKSALFRIESSKCALSEDKTLTPSDSRDPPSQTMTEKSRLEPEASQIAVLTVSNSGSETSKKEPPSTSNQKTVISETNDPTATSQEDELLDAVTTIAVKDEEAHAAPSSPAETETSESLPLGATVEEIGLLNRFLKVVGPDFNGNELSLAEREKIHDAALRENIPETFLNQMLDQSAGIRRWEDRSVYSTTSGSTRKSRRRKHKLADPHSPGASTYQTGRSFQTKMTTSSRSTRRTACTARTGYSSASNSTGYDSLSPVSEAGFGCGFKDFWSDLTGQDSMPGLSGTGYSEDSESVYSDDVSWETGKRTADPFCSAGNKR